MSGDPTMDFLASLEDETLYERKENVPAFVAHKRKFKGKDGRTQEIEVTEADLRQIAANALKREKETGTLAVIKIGHVRPEEDEESQPDILGYIRDWRVGTFGPENKTALLYTEYVKRERLQERKKYPFRSPEYYPGKKQITGVAILKRDPELDLGMVAYERTVTIGRRDGSLLCYSAEVNAMPDATQDPTMPPDPNASAQRPVIDDNAEMTEYVKHCMSHPYAAKAMAKYAAAPPAAPAMPSATNGAMPGDDSPSAPYQGADQAMVTYAKNLETRLKRTEAKLSHAEQKAARAEQANLVLQYENELSDLAAEHGLDESRAEEFVAKELPRVQTYSREQFNGYKDVLADHLEYARDPTHGGPMLKTADRAKKAKELGAKELDEVLVYMRQGMGEEEATAKVLAG